MMPILQTKPLSPLLKWAGGKTWLAPRLRELFAPHSHRRLVEPFCGGLGVALSLQPERALLNDINQHLIEFYRWVQTGGFEFYGENTEEYYYLTRDRLNDSPADSYFSAQDFYYLNLAGFNGLCRYNRNGKFNVPYGKRKKLAVCKDFKPYSKQFDRWFFINHNYQDLAVLINPDDFLIIDPPYDAGFVGYSGNAFGWEQQIELVDWLGSVPKVPQVLCNLATDRIVKLYRDRGFAIELLEAPRSISCNGDRSKVTEVLATRYLCTSMWH
jgi:DNA adenine methylase